MDTILLINLFSAQMKETYTFSETQSSHEKNVIFFWFQLVDVLFWKNEKHKKHKKFRRHFHVVTESVGETVFVEET